MRVPKKVKAPYGCAGYLTAGKEYKIVESYPRGTHKIKDDVNHEIYITLSRCRHIDFNNWIVTEWEEQ